MQQSFESLLGGDWEGERLMHKPPSTPILDPYKELFLSSHSGHLRKLPVTWGSGGVFLLGTPVSFTT